jgi:hypothetical protein
MVPLKGMFEPPASCSKKLPAMTKACITGEGIWATKVLGQVLLVLTFQLRPEPHRKHMQTNNPIKLLMKDIRASLYVQVGFTKRENRNRLL